MCLVEGMLFFESCTSHVPQVIARMPKIEVVRKIGKVNTQGRSAKKGAGAGQRWEKSKLPSANIFHQNGVEAARNRCLQL